MKTYLLKRFSLMVPTFFGATFLVFTLLNYVPGGPLERALMQIQASSLEGEVNTGSSLLGSQQLSEDVILSLKRQFGLDQPLLIRYLIWLGLWPKEVSRVEVKLGEAFREDIRYVEKGYRLYAIQRWVKPLLIDGQVEVQESGVGSDFAFSGEFNELPEEKDIIDWQKSSHWEISDKKGTSSLVLRKKEWSGVFTGNLGHSYTYDQSVISLILERLHISSYFGILGFLIAYLVCIPLGILKALRFGSKFDFWTSFVVFLGYSLPGYVVGALLLVLFGGGSFFSWFPLGGFHSPDFASLSLSGKLWDQIHHTILPVIAYSMGSFATLTVLMKNSFLEQLSQDYVRFAYAKGVREKRIIWSHLFKNSLIPIATGFGHIIGIFLAGSYLIEKVFNIHGIGLLSFKAVLDSDFPLVLGFLVINMGVLFLGNLLSDLSYALIDPRIRFE